MFTYNPSTRILCEHLWVRFHLTSLFKIGLTSDLSPVSHANQLLEGMQQNKTPEKNHMVCIVSKDLCNILTRMLNSSMHRLFSEKTAPAN